MAFLDWFNIMPITWLKFFSCLIRVFNGKFCCQRGNYRYRFLILLWLSNFENRFGKLLPLYFFRKEIGVNIGLLALCTKSAMIQENMNKYILTPNSQFIGRSFVRNPGGWEDYSKLSDRLRLVDQVANQFWSKWTELYAPMLIHQHKWTKCSPNLMLQTWKGNG